MRREPIGLLRTEQGIFERCASPRKLAIALAAWLLASWCVPASAQVPITPGERISEELLDELRPPECGPRSTEYSRLAVVCPGSLPPVCIRGHWVCERCNGRDDTGRGVPDEGRDALCEFPLTDNECGLSQCRRMPSGFSRGPDGIPVVTFETRCVYPEQRDACDDDDRCTIEGCSTGRCTHARIAGCYTPVLSLRTRTFATEIQLTILLTDAAPSAIHDVHISDVPGFGETRLVLTTDAEGNASAVQSFRFLTWLPNICGTAVPPVTVTATQRGRTENRASRNIAAFALRPCRGGT